MLRYKKNTELVDSWATIDKIFRSGKQGITGVLKTRSSPSQRFVFKVSQYIDFLIEHEFKVMTRLSELTEFCPHFCSKPEMIMCLTEAKPKKYKSPFDIVTSKPIYKPVLIEEYVKGPKLGTFIDNSKSLPVVLSAIKQVMMSILLSHDLRFTHYDLHTDNIILKPCSRNDVFLYVLDDNTAYVVPSNGYCAKIIDYGFSYVDSLENEALTTSFFHTDIGYTNDRFDWLSDAKLFLISVGYQLMNSFGQTPEVKKFSNCIHNMFGEMNVDWECGWDDFDGGSILDNLIEMLEGECRVSSFLFGKHAVDSIGILQGMITLPLEPISYDNICESYSMFIKEFVKIEDMIENPAHLFYVLKAIVDSARLLKDDYINPETRIHTVVRFKEHVLDVISSIAKFCIPKKLHYEKMLCALYAFTDCMNGYYYSSMNKRYTEKTTQYARLPVKHMREIIDILYYNFQDRYQFSKNTIINVIDRRTRTSNHFSLSKNEVDILTEAEPWMISPTLLRAYKSRFDDYQSDCEIKND